MAIGFLSGQTNGRPFVVTAVTNGTRQLLHTFPAGSAVPNLVSLFALNLDTNPLGSHSVTLVVEDNLGVALATITENIPVNCGLFPLLSNDAASILSQLIMNGASRISVFADVASMVALIGRVDDQANVAGTAYQNLASGLVAAVQNANRFAVNAQGGTGQATEANAQVKIAGAGILRNLRASVDAAVGGGATVTIAVRLNGVTTNLSLTFVNADGTADKIDTDSVAVAAGDLFCFLVACDNAGAPAANARAGVQFVGS